MDRTDFAARTRDYVTDYIKFADAKAGAVLAVGLAVSGLLGSLTDRIAAVLGGVSRPVAVIAAVVALLVVASTAMVVHHIVEALSPSITSAKKSLASFPDIAADQSWYLERCAQLTDRDIASELEQHVSHLSAIACSKFTHIAKAVWWLRIQILGAYTLVVFFVVMRVNQ